MPQTDFQDMIAQLLKECESTVPIAKISEGVRLMKDAALDVFRTNGTKQSAFVAAAITRDDFTKGDCDLQLILCNLQPAAVDAAEEDFESSRLTNIIKRLSER
ncbi:hypothetical protein MK805_06170 [Shimazuella sp. AN120528]|uniref:hypothetical protein n=1 Tax=Shimazuella soli TaxID=1892854 RepID=UPI001F0E43FB|nr:hypothetical protein [Shimazuella soli]MCH5584554.1 hypothetical protein [Shimazuella soli]